MSGVNLFIIPFAECYNLYEGLFRLIPPKFFFRKVDLLQVAMYTHALYSHACT